MHSSLAVVAAIGITATSAAPAPQWIGVPVPTNCGTHTTDTKVTKTGVKDGKADLLSWTCTSTLEGTCVLTDQASYS